MLPLSVLIVAPAARVIPLNRNVAFAGANAVAKELVVASRLLIWIGLPVNVYASSTVRELTGKYRPGKLKLMVFELPTGNAGEYPGNTTLELKVGVPVASKGVAGTRCSQLLGSFQLCPSPPPVQM